MFIFEMTPSQQIKAFLAARSCDQAASQTPQLSSSIEMTLTPPSEPSERSQPSPPSVEHPRSAAKIVIDSDEGEARRIAGELLKMKQDGVLDGPQDPEAEFCVAIIHTFGASYGCRVPQACPPPSPSAFPGTIA